jgi:hypothetical protein
VLLRLPFGISLGQVVLAAAILILFFLVAAILAARSYKRNLIR